MYSSIEYSEIMSMLSELANPERATHSQRFFKTGKGEYGEGDVFLGISVPEIRAMAMDLYLATSFKTLNTLMHSEIHECRLLAVIILTYQYKAAKKDFLRKKEIVEFYIDNRAQVNNWDIVDSSTYKILGPYVHETKDFNILHRLSDEESLWSKRMAVVAFIYLFKQGYHEEGLSIISKNLEHPHDLMHKANGWLLRELYKQVPERVLDYIHDNYTQIPRTTLRYAIERVAPAQRKALLHRSS